MKIDELKCPSCGGTVRIDQADPEKGVCEYCKTKFVMADQASSQQSPPKSSRPPYQVKVEQKKNNPIAAILFLILFVFVVFFQILRPPVKANRNQGKSTLGQSVGKEEVLEETDVVYQEFLSQVFEKPYAQAAEQQKQLQYLAVGRISGGYQFTYSLEDPALVEQYQQLSIVNESVLKCSSFNALTGLRELHLEYLQPSPEELNGLIELEGFSCTGLTVNEIAAVVPDPAQIKRLSLGRDIDDLQGLEQFTNLERLVLRNAEVTDLSYLAANQSLISLEIVNCDQITDYSVLYVMKQLQELWIDSEGLKDIGFVTEMEQLAVFGMEDSAVISIGALAGKTSLQQLSLIDNTDLADYSVMNSLTGLSILTIDKSTGQDDPDLSALTGLRSMRIQGFTDLTFLKNMAALEELDLASCNIKNPAVFAGLVNLKKLSCGRIWGDIPNLNFIASLPSLTDLNMTGIQLYGDISALFQVPTLETLILNGGEFEINFAAIQPNPALKHLELNHLKLYKNVKVQTDGFISAIDYDTVNFDENTDFLTNFPSLETLSLSENKLTQINFAAHLTALKELQIADNYITDIRPLEHLEFLERVFCAGNPVTSFEMIRENVEIYK